MNAFYTSFVYRLIFLLLWLPACAQGQDSSYAAVVARYHTQRNFNGVVLIASGGKPVFLGSAGLASRTANARMQTNTPFRIASVTKTFTAVLVMQLVEKGTLSLQGTIGQYLPAYTGSGCKKITIEHLLTYSSGLPNCEADSGDRIYSQCIPADTFIARYCSGDPEAVPGTRFSYNNGDYILLGRIIEQVTGRSFRDNLAAHILKPLGMAHTGLIMGSLYPQRLTPTYLYSDSSRTFTQDKPYCIANYFSAGAMCSTAEDLLKFDRAIFSNKLLKPATLARMLTPHPGLDNAGLGFWISGKYGAFESSFAYRPGGIWGATANWIHVLGPDRAIIVLSNTNGTNLFELSQDLNQVARSAHNADH